MTPREVHPSGHHGPVESGQVGVLAVDVRGLEKSYQGTEAVRGIDLAIRQGEVFALLGPNGAGKTTTVEILEGYRVRDRGEVSVLGVDPGRQRARLKRHTGIVLQSTGMDRYLTVRACQRDAPAQRVILRRPDTARGARVALLVVITAAFGRAFYSADIPTGATLLRMLVMLAVGAAAFCALGFAISAVIPSADASLPIVNAIILPLLFLSGVFIPLGNNRRPGWPGPAGSSRSGISSLACRRDSSVTRSAGPTS